MWCGSDSKINTNPFIIWATRLIIVNLTLYPYQSHTYSSKLTKKGLHKIKYCTRQRFVLVNIFTTVPFIYKYYFDALQVTGNSLCSGPSEHHVMVG